MCYHDEPVSVLTRELFWCLFPSLLHNAGNKHQNNPLVSAETVRHSSTYIILYITLQPTLIGRCLCWQTTYCALGNWRIYWLVVKCCARSTRSIGGQYTCHWVSYEMNAYVSYLNSYDEIKRDFLGYFIDISEATVLFNFTTVFIYPYS